LGLQWNGDRVLKGEMRRRIAEIERRGLRIALKKVRRRKLCHLSPVRLVALPNRSFYFL